MQEGKTSTILALVLSLKETSKTSFPLKLRISFLGFQIKFRLKGFLSKIKKKKTKTILVMTILKQKN